MNIDFFYFLFLTEDAYQDKLRKKNDYEYTREFVSNTHFLCIGENIYIFNKLIKNELKKIDDEYIEFICNIWQEMINNFERIKDSVNNAINFIEIYNLIESTSYIKELLNKHKGSYLIFSAL